ncbi:hypothetical protein ACH5RR_037625 [Cinchona calisaya]|uniref:Uncharacterized protein n=1 Tax=Cinchona calisaya TaxID=153742 RepID=A0ABD2Y849_9GENT
MVISWAYMLRSLEVDAQLLDGSPRLIGTGSLSNQDTCNESLPAGDVCKQTISSEILQEPDVRGEIPQEVDANHVSDHLMADDNLNSQNKDDASVHKKASAHSSSAVHIQSHLENGISSKPCMPIDAENHTQIGVDEVCSKHSNGFMERDSSVLLKDGPFDFVDKCGMELSIAGKIGNHESRPLAPNGNPFVIGTNSFGRSTSSCDPVLVCMYHCCSQCPVNLYQLLLKLLNYECSLKGSTATVEDFHDFVASLSVSLQSAVRKLFVTDSPNSVCDEKPMES